MPSLQLPSEKAHVTAQSKVKASPSGRAALQKALFAKNPAGGSRSSGSMRELSQKPAASAADAAVVPFDNGADSSASAAETEPVQSQAQTIICVKCQEETEWAASSAYGRDPFKRNCDKCSASYRSRIATIAKEKKASPNGTSAMEEFFKKLKPDEQVAWLRQA